VPISRQMMQVEEMMPVRCNMHPWMEALINVAPTAFFAVTDEAGRYTIKGLPPGDYVIGAVHEKLGEQSLHLSVKPGATTHADFAFAIQ
jgi:predicted DsbA family dithiol-disulfide isomerase